MQVVTLRCPEGHLNDGMFGRSEAVLMATLLEVLPEDAVLMTCMECGIPFTAPGWRIESHAVAATASEIEQLVCGE